MLGVNGHQLPRDLTQGKYFKYTKTAKALTSAVWPNGKIVTMPVDRLGHVNAAVAANAHRKPEWDANQQKVKTCDEYGYEMVYDVGRFLDAANACKGDRDCIFDVAFMTDTPGIADRVLERKDGQPIGKDLDLAHGTFPKNDLFQLGVRYLYANGMNAEDLDPIPKDPTLESALTNGRTYYKIGLAGANDNIKKFATEFQFHKTLREKTASITSAEREEYERRKAQFRELIAQHSAVAAAEANQIAELTEPESAKLVLPYDMQTHDPFERYDRVGEIRQIVDRVRSRAIEKFGPQHINTPHAAPQHQQQHQQHQQQQQQGARLRSQPAVAVMGSLGPSPQTTPPPKGKTTGSTPLPKAKKNKKPSNAANSCLRTEGWGFEMHGMGPISCKIGLFLRNEWARKKAGYKSCLDPLNTDCDWTPEMFTGSILDQVPLLDEHLAHRNRCRTWTGGNFTPVANNLTAATALINDNEQKVGTAWQELEPYYDRENDHGLVYKKSWGTTENYGDKDWFGAKVSYDVGWNVAAAAKTDSGDVCEIKGGLHGNIDLHATIVKRKIDVVDGNIEAQVNQSSNKYQARFKSHLIIAGDEVFQTGDDASPWITAQVVEGRDPIWGEETDRASFTYWVGGAVPVTGAMWGEMLLSFEVGAKGKSPDGCDKNPTKFSATGSFGPTFYAFGVGQVGLGVADLVSAGVRGTINLVQIQLPLRVGMTLEKHNGTPTLAFDSNLKLILATLSGRLSLYLEFLVYDEEWELFRWNGVGPATVTLMPTLTAKLPLLGMKKKGPPD